MIKIMLKMSSLILTFVLLAWEPIYSEPNYFQRKSSYPYLSGDTFRFFADWRLSTQEHFSPEEVQLGDTIFVEHDYLATFERDYLPKISAPVVLLTPYCEFNSDIPLPGIYENLSESEKIGCWFVIHLDRQATEKIQPIPIGICNNIHAHGDTSLLSYYAKLSRNVEKNIYVFCNFRIGSNPTERMPCWNYFTQQPFATCWFISLEAKERSQETFWNDMSHAQFVVSPPGAGIDAFRTWEALLLGCYPIVKSSFLNPLYEDLPVVVIEDWNEVTKDFLDKKLEEFGKKKFAWQKLFAPYWFDKIRIMQNKIRSKNNR